MSIVFLTEGILTTVQDTGRENFRRFGINPGGAMDKTALRLTNLLVGNDENEAALEIHFPAPKITFKEQAIICLGGAHFAARINETNVENWRPVYVEKNSVLTFPNKIFGNRAYLSIRGGFKIEGVLGSKSTNLKASFGGFHGRKFTKGDELFFQKNNFHETNLRFRVSRDLIPHYSSFPTVRIISGGEFEKLTAESQSKLTSENFTIRNESDRMGLRLSGDDLKMSDKFELVSSAVNFGTIQILPDGRLIVLMADHQTTGGYPRIANIITQDLPLVAQLGARDRLNFSLVSIDEAEKLIEHFEIELNYLKIAVREKYK